MKMSGFTLWATAASAAKVGVDGSSFAQRVRSVQPVKTQDHTTLFASLDEAIDTLQRNRTPDPAFIAAFDTLKQARAMLARALTTPRPLPLHEESGELIAA
jgi:hypothetical protein